MGAMQRPASRPGPSPTPVATERAATLRPMRTWLVKLGLVAVLVVLSLSIETGQAHACQCERLSPSEALVWADLVFTGTVVRDIRREWGSTSEFDVSAVLKGPRSATIVVEVDTGGTNCPLLRFARGNEYLVYAYELRHDWVKFGVHLAMPEYAGREDAFWITGACTRTARLSGAQEDLDALRGTDLSPWGVRLLAAGAVALAAAGIATTRRHSQNPRP